MSQYGDHRTKYLQSDCKINFLLSTTLQILNRLKI